MSVVRVVSLVPSGTETLLAWGVIPIAVSRFCEQPGFLTVGGTKDPDLDAIVALAPDLVVMCDQENRVEDAEALVAAGVAVHAIRITHVSHVRSQMAALAKAVGAADAPAAGIPVDATAPVRLRAWIPIWKRPWMTINADTYGSTLLASIGVENIAADCPDRYPTLPLDEVAARCPDVVLAPSEPYPFKARHIAELSTVAPVRLVDGQDLFWWGARTESARDRLDRMLADLG